MCGYAPYADGGACDDGDPCTADVCTGGACRSEIDACGICADPADADGDGTNDGCDTVDGTLTLRNAKIVAHPTKGSAAAKGNVILGPAPDAISAAAGLRVEIIAFGFNSSATWSAAECVTSGSGRITCKSADRQRRLRIRPTSKTPGAPRFDTRIRSLAVPAVPGAPVGVTIAQPGVAIERVETIATCTPKTTALVCRAP